MMDVLKSLSDNLNLHVIFVLSLVDCLFVIEDEIILVLGTSDFQKLTFWVVCPETLGPVQILH
jgi:hypothetical protein